MENESNSKMRFLSSGIKRSVISIKYLMNVVVIFMLSVISISLVKSIYLAASTMPEKYIEIFKIGNIYNFGVLSISDENVLYSNYCDDFIKGILSGSFFVCITSVFIPSFIVYDYKNGYTKIAIMRGMSRISLYNNYILISLISMLPLIITGVLGLFISLFCNAINQTNDIYEILKTLVFQVILISAVCICFAVVSIVILDPAATVINVFSIFVIPLIPGYLRPFIGEKLNIEKFLLLNQVINSGNMCSTELWYTVLIAFITVIIFYFIGLLIFNKKSFA